MLLYESVFMRKVMFLLNLDYSALLLHLLWLKFGEDNLENAVLNCSAYGVTVNIVGQE